VLGVDSMRERGRARLHALRVTEYEYPKESGNILRCNDWRLDLFADGLRGAG